MTEKEINELAKNIVERHHPNAPETILAHAVLDLIEQRRSQSTAFQLVLERNQKLFKAIAYLRRKIDGYDTVFETVSEIIDIDLNDAFDLEAMCPKED